MAKHESRGNGRGAQNVRIQLLGLHTNQKGAIGAGCRKKRLKAKKEERGTI